MTAGLSSRRMAFESAPAMNFIRIPDGSVPSRLQPPQGGT
jgi:hypothetical protein